MHIMYMVLVRFYYLIVLNLGLMCLSCIELHHFRKMRCQIFEFGRNKSQPEIIFLYMVLTPTLTFFSHCIYFGPKYELNKFILFNCKY